MLPVGSCNRRRVSVYADAGFEATGPEVVGRAAALGATCGARPSRSAFSFSVLSRRSSLSAAILALILSLAATSSCFSLRLAAASLSCSFFFRSSLISCVSLVLFRRISYDPSQPALRIANSARSYLILLFIQLILLRCAKPLLGKFSSELFKLCPLLFLSERRDFLGGFRKVNVAGLGSVQFGLCMASKLPATITTHERLGFLARLQVCWHCIGVYLGFGLYCGNFLERFPFHLLEPPDCCCHCSKCQCLS